VAQRLVGPSHATLTTMSFAKRHRRVLLFDAECVLAGAVLGFSPYFRRTTSQVPTEPLFSRLGPHTRQVATGSPLCQRYFDQGLAFLFGFTPCLCLPGKD
jgi:hypothetical protein